MRSVFRSVLVALVAVLAFGAVAASGASAHQWLVNGVEASGQEVSIVGGENIKIESGPGRTIECEGAVGKGTVKAGGLGEATITWKGCNTNNSNCLVKTPGQPNGTIGAANLPTKLTVQEDVNGPVLADEFKEKTSKEWTTFEFEETVTGACSSYPTPSVKAKGHISAATTGLSNGNVQLLFPPGEFISNTLNWGGEPLRFYTAFEMHLISGEKLTAS